MPLFEGKEPQNLNQSDPIRLIFIALQSVTVKSSPLSAGFSLLPMEFAQLCPILGAEIYERLKKHKEGDIGKRRALDDILAHLQVKGRREWGRQETERFDDRLGFAIVCNSSFS